MHKVSSYFSFIMINHHVMRLDVSVHYAFTMTEVKCLCHKLILLSRLRGNFKLYLKKLENVVSYVEVNEFGIQASEIGVVDIFEDE